MATYGNTEQFNGKKEEWEQYIECAELFYVANDFEKIQPAGEDDAAVKKRHDKKCAIFLSLIGPETHSLLHLDLSRCPLLMYVIYSSSIIDN